MHKSVLIGIFLAFLLSGCAFKKPDIREYTRQWGQSALAIDDKSLSDLIAKYGKPDAERVTQSGKVVRAIYYSQFDHEETALWLNTYYTPNENYDVDIVRTDFLFKNGYVEQFLVKYKYPVLVRVVDGEFSYTVLKD